MNQENRIINVHLKKDNKKDYLVFEFDEDIKVCLNSDSSQNELKRVFSAILTLIIKEPVTLEFIDSSEYNTGLYIDVCKEYIRDLNKEITVVRKNIPEKLVV